MPGRRSKFFETEAENRTFGELLDWHLRYWGTRPTKSPDARGEVWSVPDFAAKVGRDPRTVDYWLDDTSSPGAILDRIETLLFGTNPAYSEWRRHLRVLHAAAKKTNRTAKEPKGASVVHSQAPSRSKRPKRQVAPPPWTPMHSPYFVGRGHQLKQLHEAIAAAQNDCGLVALSGLPGIGKSSTAAEYIHTYGGHYDGIWWCRAETPDGLIADLGALRRELSPDLEALAGAKDEAHRALKQLAQRGHRWLVVYDNAPPPDQFLREMLPRVGAKILVTSRFQRWSRLGTQLLLEALPLEDAVKLLETQTNRGDPQGAAALAKDLDKLPLALDHASAFCRRFGASYAHFAKSIAERVKFYPAGSDYPLSVYATFDIAMDAVIKGSGGQLAEVVMATISHCAPERLPITALTHDHKMEADFEASVIALADMSLLRLTPYEDGVPGATVHRTVQAVGRVRWRQTEIAQYAIDRLVDWLIKAYPTDFEGEPHAWPICDALNPHVLALKAGTPQPNHYLWNQLLLRVGQYLRTRGSTDQGELLVEDAVAAGLRVNGESDELTAMCFDVLSDIAREKGELDAALALIARARDIKRNAMRGRLKTMEGRANAARLEGGSLRRLASVHREKGNDEEAKSLYREALQIAESTEGRDSVVAASLMSDIASFGRWHDTDEAFKLDQEALRILESHPDAEVLDIIGALQCVANWHLQLDQFDAARSLLDRALKRSEALGVPPDGAMVNTLTLLMDASVMSGDKEGALAIGHRVVRLADETFGLEDQRTGILHGNVASLCVSQGLPTTAIDLVKTFLPLHESSHGKDAVSTQQLAGAYCDALTALGRVEEAARLATHFFGARDR